MVELSSVDLVKRLIVMVDGSTFPIVNVFDGHGLETRDYRHAVACIADLDGGAVFVRLGDYDRRALH